MWKKFPPTDWRSIDPLAFNYFSTLLTSRVNIFLYGLNGIGKTKFAQKCLDENNIEFCYVDCLEYYNEKLICFTISNQLKLVDKEFKDSKTFVALKDNLLIWDIHNNRKERPIYIVLDNVERIISIEKVKKNLEKMFIVADMVAPLISVLIIHDTYIDEVDAFAKSLFNEYNFTPFVLDPMDSESMKAVIKEKYFQSDPEDVDKDKFDSFINMLHQNLEKQTVNLKKWLFLTKLLFKVYCNEPLGKFRKILRHVTQNFYSNVVDIQDIEAEMAREKEESEQKKAESLMKANSDNKARKKSCFKPNKVTFYDEIKNEHKTSYTFVEAMILLSAFLAAHNKESNDEVHFSGVRSVRQKKGKRKNNAENNFTITHLDLGKTKKFSMERMLTIFQYFLSLYCSDSEEAKLYHHSINVYAKINTFVSENLFKRSQGRNEDPSAVSLKINYDKHMIEEVLEQFSDIQLEDFLEVK